MGSPRAKLGVGVSNRGGDGLLYSHPRLFSTKYARHAQYARGQSSLHDPTSFTRRRVGRTVSCFWVAHSLALATTSKRIQARLMFSIFNSGNGISSDSAIS